MTLHKLHSGFKRLAEFIYSFSCLIVVRAALFFVSYRKISPFIVMRSSDEEPDPFRWAWLIRRASKLVPMASCLTQALALQYILSRKGLSSSVRIGVRNDHNGKIEAHAWVVSQGKVLIGAEKADLSSFGVLTDLTPQSEPQNV